MFVVPASSPGLLDIHAEHLERVRQNYNEGLGTLVSSHNDAHPGNLLFDGQRLWLIDWESAYRNDPLVDLAILIDSFAFPPELEAVLARAWVNNPDESFHSRLTTVRALTRLYYAGVFLSSSAASQSGTPPTLAFRCLRLRSSSKAFVTAPGVRRPAKRYTL